MATITSGTLPATLISRHSRSRPVASFKTYWRQFFAKAFDPYRPELHYMRGPGPAWRAKHNAR